MTDKETLMAKGKARWLLDGGIDELDDEQRALLLALVSLEADTGRELNDEEREALKQMIERSGAGGEEITSAVRHMVEAEPKKRRRLDWSALKARLTRKRQLD